MTKEILEPCHQKDKLWVWCKHNPNDMTLKNKFQALINKVTATIRLARKKPCIDKFNVMIVM